MPPKTKTPAKPKKSKIDRNLDELHAALVTKGAETHVAVLIKEVYQVDEPEAERILAAVEMLAVDERFSVVKDGIKSRVRIAGPEDITLAATNGEIEIKLEGDPQMSRVTTTTMEPVKTIGELAEDAKKEEAAKKAEPRPAAAPHSKADDRLEEIEAATEQYEKDLQFETLKKKDARSATNARKASHEHLLEVLGGQGTILKKGGEVKKDPAQMQTGRKAQDAKAPAAAKDKGTDALPDPRAQGAKAAIAGKTERDCPHTDAVSALRWMDGWREAMRTDASERRAIVQAMTDKKLMAAMIPKNGLLEPGKDKPKVAHVMVDARPHMVVGCLPGNIGPVKGVDRWHLQPLFEIADWSALHQQTYGPPVDLADASDEARANRIKGGVDCGKIVRVGKAKYVVGPRQLLTVLTVGEATPASVSARA